MVVGYTLCDFLLMFNCFVAEKVLLLDVGGYCFVLGWLTPSSELQLLKEL